MTNRHRHSSGRPHKVRVGGGRLRGSVLPVADMAMLRPSPSRVRDTLFNWLMPVLPGMRCLDVFAGSGILGIEAVSRGAQQAVFVEKNPQLARTLQDNLTRLHIDTCTTVRCQDALQYLTVPPAEAFDLVFVDPPFQLDAWHDVMRKLEGKQWLASDAWIYVELPRGFSPQAPANWHVHRSATAGEVAYILYTRMAPTVNPS